MDVIYKSSLNNITMQAIFLPIFLLNQIEPSSIVNMVKNSDYLEHPIIMFFFVLFFMIFTLSPQTIRVNSTYILKYHTFLPFFSTEIYLDDIEKVTYSPSSQNSVFSSITIKSKNKSFSIKTALFYTYYCSIPELRHANLGQVIQQLTQFKINTQTNEAPIIEGFFIKPLKAQPIPTLKNTRYRFVLACGALTLLAIFFWILGKAYLPALRFDNSLLFFFSIFISCFLFAFLFIKENPKHEYISNIVTCFLFGLMMWLSSYILLSYLAITQTMPKLVSYTLVKKGENNQQWQASNQDFPSIEVNYESTKPLNSQEQVHIYTGFFNMQVISLKEHRELTK